ncbi:hypothetical protein HYPSUDRAFT_275627, partial [Hypholoma sublateritium FD-334 SS-4]
MCLSICSARPAINSTHPPSYQYRSESHCTPDPVGHPSFFSVNIRSGIGYQPRRRQDTQYIPPPPLSSTHCVTTHAPAATVPRFPYAPRSLYSVSHAY